MKTAARTKNAIQRKKTSLKKETGILKGHCHGNFAIFWSKPLKYLTKSLFFFFLNEIAHTTLGRKY